MALNTLLIPVSYDSVSEYRVVGCVLRNQQAAMRDYPPVRSNWQLGMLLVGTPSVEEISALINLRYTPRIKNISSGMLKHIGFNTFTVDADKIPPDEARIQFISAGVATDPSYPHAQYNVVLANTMGPVQITGTDEFKTEGYYTLRTAANIDKNLMWLLLQVEQTFKEHGFPYKPLVESNDVNPV